MPQDNYEVRQSSFGNGDVIDAPLFNAEYDQLVRTFATETGHTHNGDAGGGANVPHIATIDGGTGIRVDTSNPSDAKLIFRIAGTDIITFTEANGTVVLESEHVLHKGGPLDTYLAGLETAVGNAATDAAAAEDSAVRAEAAAADLGVPVIIADGGTHVIDNLAALADLVFMGDGTVTLPTTLVQGRRFTVRVSFTAISTKRVLIENPNFTLVGDKVSVVAGTDLELSPGELVVLESISTTELEII